MSIIAASIAEHLLQMILSFAIAAAVFRKSGFDQRAQNGPKTDLVSNCVG
jgi:hypothetical protein